MTFWKSIDGIIEVEMTAADPERMLTDITLAGIELFSIRHEKDLVCSFSVRRRD